MPSQARLCTTERKTLYVQSQKREVSITGWCECRFPSGRSDEKLSSTIVGTTAGRRRAQPSTRSPLHTATMDVGPRSSKASRSFPPSTFTSRLRRPENILAFFLGAKISILVKREAVGGSYKSSFFRVGDLCQLDRPSGGSPERRGLA